MLEKIWEEILFQGFQNEPVLPASLVYSIQTSAASWPWEFRDNKSGVLQTSELMLICSSCRKLMQSYSKCAVSGVLAFPKNSVLPLYKLVSSPGWLTKTQFPHHKTCRKFYARCCALYVNQPLKSWPLPPWTVLAIVSHGWRHGCSPY